MILNYIANTPTYFGASAPSSGTLYSVFIVYFIHQVIVLKTTLKFTLKLPNAATYTHQQGHYQYMQPHHHQFNHTPLYHN
jgi:hypothetical protein